MRVLLTNDDGFDSPGLWAVAAALKEVAEVTVCAPDRDQSGTGTSVSLQSPIRLKEVTAPVAGVSAWSVEGTPSDAAIIALETLLRDQVDLVVAGINIGANLGEDVLISGTVGAALQGYFRGIPALALSVTTLTDPHFQSAATVAKLMVQRLGENALFRSGSPPGTSRKPLLLNINVPNVSLDKIEGVELTRLGRRAYADSVKEGDDGRRKWYWVSRNRPAWRFVKGTDIWAVRHNRVSITPLHTNLTRGAFLRSLEPLRNDLSAALGLSSFSSDA